MKLFYLTGKGGVGKTTLSIILARKLSKKGNTFLVSLDPAPNLGDYLGIKIGDRKRKVDNFWVREIDAESSLKKLLNEILETLRRTHPELSLFNVDGELELFKYSPGSIEAALIDELKDLLKEKMDYIVLDMPATGQTVRILTYIISSRMWVQKLIEMRRKIVEEETAIRKIKGDEESADMIISKLREIQEELAGLYRHFKEATSIVVAEPYEASLNEARKFSEFLRKYLKPLSFFILNKVKENKHYSNCSYGGKIVVVPFRDSILSEELEGILDQIY